MKMSFQTLKTLVHLQNTNADILMNSESFPSIDCYSTTSSKS